MLEYKLHDQGRNSIHHGYQKNAFCGPVFMGIDIEGK